MSMVAAAKFHEDFFYSNKCASSQPVGRDRVARALRGDGARDECGVPSAASGAVGSDIVYDSTSQYRNTIV